MKLKRLKALLAKLPKEADEFPVMFEMDELIPFDSVDVSGYTEDGGFSDRDPDSKKKAVIFS